MFCVGLGVESGCICRFQTRSRSEKCVAVLGALPHCVRGVCQVPTHFYGLETAYTSTLHPPPRKSLLGAWRLRFRGIRFTTRARNTHHNGCMSAARGGHAGGCHTASVRNSSQHTHIPPDAPHRSDCHIRLRRTGSEETA